MTRRRFGMVAGRAVAAYTLGYGVSETPQTAEGRLTARPRPNVKAYSGGVHALGLSRSRDAILRIPATTAGGSLPLLLLLHGAGGSAEHVLLQLGSAPTDAGIAVLAPYSRGSTWDGIRSRFGPDVTFLNGALERVFEMAAIDPVRMAIGGFSDGATYGLSLGLINGDLFTRVVAFSPGFIIGGTPHGMPRVFISHGNADPVLPIDSCSRRIVANLRKRGYQITFREFRGGHEIPADIARAGMQWLAEPM